MRVLDVNNYQVAVLLAAYNGEHHIIEQMESILAQDCTEVTIFMSIDQSSDSTLKIAKDYEVRYPDKIKVLPYGERFGSAGSNFFRLLVNVDFSSFDYVAFADQDDIWLSHKLSTSITEMKAAQADAYSGNVTAFWPDERKVLIKKDYPQKSFDYLFESAGPGCTFVFSRDLALSIQTMLRKKPSQVSSLWLHDWFCYSYARHNGYKWHIGSEPLMLYRQHMNNQVGANSGISALLSRMKVVLSGEAFAKVLTQAHFIEQDDLPIKYIRKNTFSSLISLSLHAFKCRRNNKESILFFIALVLLSFKVLFTKNE